ncbi:MAG: RluA family pseudouridine synthase [Chloroflexota bacterium]|nr:RluA family pseudouridine synthase [Chloroflexota bacterium]
MTQNEYRFVVKQEEYLRIDIFLSDQLPNYSRSKIKRFIQSGNVTVDGMVAKKAGTKIKAGSVVGVLTQDDESEGITPENLPLNIIYEDDHVIVLNKTAGMVVHPGAGNPSGTLVNALLAYYPPIRNVGEADRPGVVHRLDKDTSGVLIFAKTDKAYRWLIKQFKTRELQKIYLALVDGHPPTPSGRIEAPIERDIHHRTRMAVGMRGQGKLAISEYFELQRFINHSLLEIHLITGRTHQIRVHLKYIGVPVVGDMLYGHRHPSIKLERNFLHAKSLSVKLPDDRVPKTFEAPLPDELKSILFELEKDERK